MRTDVSSMGRQYRAASLPSDGAFFEEMRMPPFMTCTLRRVLPARRAELARERKRDLDA